MNEDADRLSAVDTQSGGLRSVDVDALDVLERLPSAQLRAALFSVLRTHDANTLNHQSHVSHSNNADE